MFKKWRKKFSEVGFKYKEDVDFRIVPDLEAAKRDDPHPWNITFLSRMFKVHSLKIPDKPGADGHLHVDLNIEVLYGEPFTPVEEQQLGELLMELVQRNLIERK